MMVAVSTNNSDSKNNAINLNLPRELVFVYTFGASEVPVDFLDADIGESERSHPVIWKVQLKA